MFSQRRGESDLNAARAFPDKKKTGKVLGSHNGLVALISELFSGRPTIADHLHECRQLTAGFHCARNIDRMAPDTVCSKKFDLIPLEDRQMRMIVLAKISKGFRGCPALFWSRTNQLLMRFKNVFRWPRTLRIHDSPPERSLLF